MSGFGRFFCRFGPSEHSSPGQEPAISFHIPKIDLSKIKPGNYGLVEMLVLTVLLVSLLMFIVYQLANSRFEPDTVELKQQAGFLGKELAALSERFERNQARLIVVEREAEVFREATRLLRSEESQRQAELNRMQSELDFYRRLAGTSGTQTELAVYAAELITTDSDRVFRFILTLTQNIRRASVISGWARIDIDGTLDNRPVALNWAEVTDDSMPKPSFRFKYFQQIEGYLAMPENFNPIRIRVTLEVKDQHQPVIQTFEWDELFDGPRENHESAED